MQNLHKKLNAQKICVGKPEGGKYLEYSGEKMNKY
jgi:hypothetical protein